MCKIAIVTQSYKNDFNECKLLCDSIDRFASEIDHFIFVNDEDAQLFGCMNYKRHKVFKKSTVLPWYLVRVPFKMLGHHFYISPLTIPVREWIIQQICKLGVFEVIGNEYDAVFNIDSETVLMRPLDKTKWIRDGKFIMFRTLNVDEPSHDDYCKAAKKLLSLPVPISEFGKYNYMNTPVCFVRENTANLLEAIRVKSKLKNWKLALCNTYRFSEYYTYGIYTDCVLGGRNHVIIDKHLFPQVDISECADENIFRWKVETAMRDENVMGLWLQKKDRKSLESRYLDFRKVEHVVKDYWNLYELPIIR